MLRGPAPASRRGRHGAPLPSRAPRVTCPGPGSGTNPLPPLTHTCNVSAMAADDPLASFTGRFPTSILERLGRLAEAMSTATAGVNVSRSDAMRAAVEAGLPGLEARY